MASENFYGVPQQLKDWANLVKKKIEDTDDGTASMVKFVAIGAAGTVAVGSVLIGLYRAVSPSERALQNRVKHQRLRLLASRRSPTRNGNSNSNDMSPAAAEEAKREAAQAKPVFEQFSAAYTNPAQLTKHTGGCHCGNVRFIVEAPRDLDCIDSDKNMYTLKGRFPHIVVPKSRVVLLTNNDNLGVYHFGKKPLGPLREVFEFQNLFCKACGVHCFGYNKAKDTMHVNSMCLDMDDVERISVSFDSDRSSWHVMNPLLYEPSIPHALGLHHLQSEEEYLGLDKSSDNSLAVPASKPWKEPLDAYSNLSNLGMAAGVIKESSSKPSPLLATSPAAGDYDNDTRRTIMEDDPSITLFSDMAMNEKGDFSLISDDITETPLTKLFSVERLRMHLQKHVQDGTNEAEDAEQVE